MKIYTKTGDQGTTSLYGGRRVSKSDTRINAYGTIDELNSFIGVLIASMNDSAQLPLLGEIQMRLFTIGSILAQDQEKGLPIPDLLESDIEKLENGIDNMNADIEPLKFFILPGGSIESAHAHVCRTVTRRAERIVIALTDEMDVPAIVVKYLNRLSDYFFVLARLLNVQAGVKDVPWKARK